MGNLHLITGHAGRPHVEAADHASLHAAIFGEGEYVLDRGSNFGNTIISNNQIRIADGDLLMQGRHIRLDEGSYVDLTVENGQQGAVRNDLIVVRYIKDGLTGVEDCNLVVIKGTARAGSATDPEYTSGSIIHDNVLIADMPLYRIRIVNLTIEELVPLFELRLNVGESINNVLNVVNSHVSSKNNPHGVTAAQIGAVTKEYVDDALNSKLSMELLWENASPTSEFASQTVLTAPATNGYEFFVVGVRNRTDSDLVVNFGAKRGSTTTLHMLDSTTTTICRRFLYIDSAGSVQFQSAIYSASTYSGKYCIPLYVYGIKGVSA